MLKFIRIKNKLVNAHYVNTVISTPESHKIYVTSHNSEGWLFYGCGFMTCKEEKYIITKKDEPDDYAYITEWCKKHLD